MSKHNPLSGAIRFALIAGAASLMAAPAFAQEEDEATSLEQIVVTGSRIQSQTVTASAPVTEIGREDFTVSGATRVDDLVNQCRQSRKSRGNGKLARRKILSVPIQNRFAYAPTGKRKKPRVPA